MLTASCFLNLEVGVLSPAQCSFFQSPCLPQGRPHALAPICVPTCPPRLLSGTLLPTHVVPRKRETARVGRAGTPVKRQRVSLQQITDTPAAPQAPWLEGEGWLRADAGARSSAHGKNPGHLGNHARAHRPEERRHASRLSARR